MSKVERRIRLPDQTQAEIEKIRRDVGLVPTIQKLNTNGPKPNFVTRRNAPFDAKSPFIKSNEK